MTGESGLFISESFISSNLIHYKDTKKIGKRMPADGLWMPKGAEEGAVGEDE